MNYQRIFLFLSSAITKEWISKSANFKGELRVFCIEIIIIKTETKQYTYQFSWFISLALIH